MRCAKSCEGGDEGDAFCGGYGFGKGRAFSGSFDDAERISEPLYRASRVENAALKGVGGFAVKLPGGCGDKIFVEDRFASDVHQREASCTVGVFDVADGKAFLPKKCRLLVSDGGKDGKIPQNGGNVLVFFDFTEVVGRRLDFRKHTFGNSKKIAQLFVPSALVDVKQHRAGGVCDVGIMVAGQAPDQPRVYRTGKKLTTGTFFFGAFDVFKDPFDLACRKVSVDRKPCFLLDGLAVSVGF